MAGSSACWPSRRHGWAGPAAREARRPAGPAGSPNEAEPQLAEAEAYRDAELIRGEGDAKASALYAEAFGRDPQFAQFYRSLEAYRATFRSKGDMMVLDPSGDFFRAMRNGSPPAGR